jgi:solute carrier family 39 (zinc transporter), member 9
MLFSAGTFLYVATVHVLPEITHEQQLKFTELLALIGGAFIPSLLTVKHHH